MAHLCRRGCWFDVLLHSSWLAMVVDSHPTSVIPVQLNGSEETDLSEGNQLSEDQPNVHKLHVGGGGQLVHDRDEECRDHQHGCQVDC